MSTTSFAQLSADFSASATEGCSSFSVTFTDLSTGGPTSWSWDFGDGQTSTKQNPSVIYSLPGTYTVSLTVKNGNNTSTATKLNYIIVNAPPQAQFISSPSSGCLPLTDTFTDQSIAGAGTITNWNWDFGDGGFDTIQSPIHIYTTEGIYTVTLTVKDSKGCSNTFKADTLIHTNTKPVVTFTFPFLYTCASDPIPFRNKTTGTVTAWHWDFGDGDTSDREKPVHYFSDTGYMRIVLTATNGVCSDSSVSNRVLYVKPPIVRMRANYSCSDRYTRTFDAKYLGATSHYWDFGDGSTISTDSIPSHTYAKPGNYMVKLFSFGPECNYVDSEMVTIIDENPIIKYSGSGSTICKNDTVQFTATNYDPTLITTFMWNYGDGNAGVFSSSNIDYHIYKQAGNYSPSLITQDILGCYDTTANTVTVPVYGPKAGFSNAAVSCVREQVSFSDLSSTDSIHPISKWIWDFGDGAIDTLQSPPFTHAYNVSNTYTVKLKLIDAIGCTDTASKINALTTQPKPVADFAISDSMNCFSTPVSFTDNSQGQLVQRLWDFGDGATATEATPVHTYALPSNYDVTLIVSNGACTDTVSRSVNVIPLPKVDAGGDSIICYGQSVSLRPSGATTYAWTADTSLSCTLCNNPSANPQASTTYYVTGTDANGCSASDSVHVDVKQPIVLSLASSDTACLGTPLQLNASPGAEIYTWQPSTGLNNPNIQNPVATLLSTGKFTYTVTATDSKSCFTDTASISLTVGAYPQFNIIDSNVTTNANGTYIIRTTNSPDIIIWQWSPATNLSCTNCAEPVATVNTMMQYTGVATNAYGCSTSDRITIKGMCTSDLFFVPNTFSPNGDNVNDYFYPRGHGLYLIKSMRIFNRVGQMVFEKTNFAPENQSEGWDGTFHSKKLPADVYVYFIEAICNNGLVLKYKGDITLLR